MLVIGSGITEGFSIAVSNCYTFFLPEIFLFLFQSKECFFNLINNVYKRLIVTDRTFLYIVIIKKKVSGHCFIQYNVGNSGQDKRQEAKTRQWKRNSETVLHSEFTDLHMHENMYTESRGYK